MFFDKAKIYVLGGYGGSGCVAMRREKYVPLGGPWGGDGGRGGDVILEGEEGLNTLIDFRHKHHFKATRGQHGMGKGMHGRGADDLIIKVPVGTIVRDAESGDFIADIVTHGQRILVAKGGRGGRGNMRFATAKVKAPNFAEKGEPGAEHWLILELKLIADVGLVGFPNAGKSTLISTVSDAKPKIADYPFTTIVPNLGVVRSPEGDGFVVADIPGLIEGAHEGIGLGHEFLRHVERTRLLVHVLDTAGTEGRNPLNDFHVINGELKKYNEKLATRPMIIVANKMDIPEAEENLIELQRELGETYEIFPISAVTTAGVKPLISRIRQLLNEIPKEELPQPGEEEKLISYKPEPRFIIRKENEMFVVSGAEIERHLVMSELNNSDSLERLGMIMDKMGIYDALRKAGAKEGDYVKVKQFVFEYVD